MGFFFYLNPLAFRPLRFIPESNKKKHFIVAYFIVTWFIV